MIRMKYHYKTTQYKASFLTIVCFFLFVSYSLLLYLKHQYGVVALSYAIESGTFTSDITDSATWISALLGTILCSIPAIVLLSTLHFPLSMKALAFLPSYIILGFLTGISPLGVASTENELHLLSPLLMLMVSGLLILFSQVYHEDRGEHAPIFNYLGINVLVSCIGMLACIALTNTDRQLHVQLAMADAIYRNDTLKLERIVKGETVSNHNITAIQVLDLSRRGLLADRLFSIKGLAGSESMLPDTMPASQVYHTSSLVYEHLDVAPYGDSISVSCYLEKSLLERRSLPADSLSSADSLSLDVLTDYYLCSLLLDRDLERFPSALSKYYGKEYALPLHYREALCIIASDDADINIEYVADSVMHARYTDYMKLRQSQHDASAIQLKECNKAYPGSYWNYYYSETH